MKVDDLASASQSTFVSIALDSTKLISADSFLFDAPSYKDPRAKSDFQVVTTVFCNESAPYFATPKSRKEQPHAPELLKLWQRSATRYDTVSVSLEDDRLFAEMAPIFAQEFRDPAKAAELEAWVRYQLSSDDLVAVFWEGGNSTTHLEQALSHVDALLDKKHPLSRRLNNIQLQIDGEFLNRRLDSVAAIAKAYAFFAFKKGRDYVYKLPTGPTYVPHWLREPAQPEGDKKKSTIIGELPATFFRWGGLLTVLMGNPKYSFHVGAEKLAEVLTKLRTMTIQAQPYKAVREKDPEKWVEIFVIEALHDAAGWIPPKERRAAWPEYVTLGRKWAEKYVEECLKDSGASGSESVGPAIEATWYTIGRNVVRSTEYGGRRLYHRLVPRSHALQVYSSKEIRQRARVFIKGVRDASAIGNVTSSVLPKSHGKAKSPRV